MATSKQRVKQYNTNRVLNQREEERFQRLMRDRVSRATATLDTGMRKKPKAEPRRSQADSATPDAWTPALPHVVRDVDEIEKLLSTAFQGRLDMSLANKLSSRMAHLRQLATGGHGTAQLEGEATQRDASAHPPACAVPAHRSGTTQQPAPPGRHNEQQQASGRDVQGREGDTQLSRSAQAAQFAARLASQFRPEQQADAGAVGGVNAAPRRAQKAAASKRSKHGQEQRRVKPAANRPGWDGSFASAAQATYVPNVRNCKQVTRFHARSATASGHPRSADALAERTHLQPRPSKMRATPPSDRSGVTRPAGAQRAPVPVAKERFAKCLARQGAPMQSQRRVNGHVQPHRRLDAIDSGAPGSLFDKYAGRVGLSGDVSSASVRGALGLSPAVDVSASQQTIQIASVSGTPAQRGPPDVLAVATPPRFSMEGGLEGSRSLSLCGFDAAMCGSTDLVRLEASAQLGHASSDREPSGRRSATPDAALPAQVTVFMCAQPASALNRPFARTDAQRVAGSGCWPDSSHVRSGSLLHGQEIAAGSTRGSAPWSDTSQAAEEPARKAQQPAVACSPLGQHVAGSNAVPALAQPLPCEPDAQPSRTHSSGKDPKHNDNAEPSDRYSDESAGSTPTASAQGLDCCVLAEDDGDAGEAIPSLHEDAGSQHNGDQDADLLDSIDLAKLRFSEEGHGWGAPAPQDSSATFREYMAGAHAWDGMHGEELPPALPQMPDVDPVTDVQVSDGTTASERAGPVGVLPHAGSLSEDYSASDYDD